MTIMPDRPTRRVEVIRPTTIAFDDDKTNWPTAFASLQILPRRSVTLTVNGSKTPIEIAPESVPDRYLPAPRLRLREPGAQVAPDERRCGAKLGFDDTIDNILSIYAMLRSLAQQRVGPKAMGGRF